MSNGLVGKAVAHDERRVTGGTAEVHQSAFSEDDYRLTAGVDVLVDRAAFHVVGLDHLLFNVGAIVEVGNVDFVVKVANIADDAVVFHFVEMHSTNDVCVAGCGNENVALIRDVFESCDLEAFHRGLQSVDWIDFGDDDPRTESLHRGGTSFADVSVAANYDDLAGNHDVGGSFDAVSQ